MIMNDLKHLLDSVFLSYLPSNFLRSPFEKHWFRQQIILEKSVLQIKSQQSEINKQINK